MRLLALLFFLPFASCSYTDGNYIIKTFDNGSEITYKASAIQIIDESNKIKFKDLTGTHSFTGSFEVYKVK